MDSEIKININFIKKLSLQEYENKVSAQNINGSKQDFFGMVVTFFSMEDKEAISLFFQDILLLTDISIDNTLGMSFFTLSNIEIYLIGYYIY